MAIKKINSESLYNIKRKSAKALPDKPSAQGYTAEEIKNYLTNFVIDDTDSFKAELDRIVDEINSFISGIENDILKNYITDAIVAKFTEQNPIISLNFNKETKLLEYSKFLNSSTIDLLPDDSVFIVDDVLKNKQGSLVHPKTSIDKLIDTIDNKTVREYILNLNSKIETLLSKHDNEISTINENIAAIIGGDAPAALDSIKELAEALNNNPSQVDNILLQIKGLEDGKVEKVAGKQLSTNDYSDEDKAFVDSLKTKDLVEEQELKTDLKQFNDDSKHRLVTDEEKQYWSGKEDKGHNHEIEDVNGLKDELDSKSSSLHTHTPEEIGAEKTGVAKNLVNNHNSDKESHEDIRKHINDVEKKVDGINQAISFYNESQLTDWIAGTYTRTDGKTVSDLFVGQHIYIEEQDERDFWVKETPVTSINNLAELVTDKILLEDYSLKEDLADVATSGSYKHLKDTPTIYYKLSEMTPDPENRTISDKKLEQIDTNTRKIEEKIDKNLGSSEANKMIVTDENGNIITAEAGSMSILVNNLESTSTTMAPTANMVRELNNIKLNKQQGTDNSGKHLVVNDEGLIDLENQKTKLSEFENDKKFATEDYVNVNGGKIDTIKIKGTVVNPVQKVVDLDVPTNDEFEELLEEVAGKQEQLSENQLLSVNSGADAGKINQIEANRLNIENLKNDKVDKVSGKGLSTNDFTNDDKNKLDSLENYVDDALRVGISDINSKIPDTASSTNKLADQAFVNSSIATNTATFRQTHNSYDELPTTGVDEQDYAFVKTIDASGNTVYKRYKYTNGKWEFEYELNNSSFTAQQWASINSEITKELKEQIITNKNNISSNASNISTNASSITNLQNDKEDKSNLKKLAYKDGLTANEVGAIPKAEKPNINGNNSYTSNNNFYAPTAKGNYGQLLMSNGTDAPSWTNMPDIQGSVTLKGLLPEEYQEVEYLECDGNQYIDIGFAPSSGVYIKLSSLVTNVDDYMPLIGTLDTKYGIGYLNETRVGTWYWTGSYLNGNYLDSPESLYNKTIDWEIQTGPNSFYKIKIGNQVVTKEYTNNLNYEYGKNLHLFYDGMHYFKGRVGRIKIVQEGEIVRDLIPCYRKEDNEIGLYDLINGGFYANLGSSKLIMGNVVEDATVKQYQFMAQNIYQGTKLLDDTYAPLSRKVNSHDLNKDIELELKDLPNYEWANDNLSIFLKNESIKSSNLINLEGEEETITERGLTIKRRTDGTFLFNGTVTSGSTFLRIQILPTLKVIPTISTAYINKSSFFDIDETTNYFISSNILSGNCSNYGLISQNWNVHTNGQAITNVTTFPGGWSKAYNNGDYINSITITLDANVSFENAIIGIKLEKGSSNTGYADWNGKIIREKQLEKFKSELPKMPDVSNFITKDVNDLTNYTLSVDEASVIKLSMNNTTYVLTIQLLNSKGEEVSKDTIDFPLETMVVDANYDSTNKKIVLTLKNGATTSFSVADLVSGLATQSALNTTNTNVTNLTTRVGTAETNITNLQKNKADSSSLSNYVPTTRKINNKALSADITLTQDDVGDGTTYKRVTATEKTNWNNKSDFSGAYSDLTGKPTIPTVNNGKLTIKRNNTELGSFNANQSNNTSINIEVPTDYATKSEGVYYVEGNTTGTEGVWTGTNSRITSYYDGLVVNFKVGIVGISDGTTLNINSLGAKPCYLRGTTKVTTHYAVGTLVMFSYSADADAFYSSDYDANNYAYARQYGNVTTNSNFPILFSKSATVPSTYTNNYTSSQSGFTFNPSTKTLTATNIKGTTLYENGTSLVNKYLGKTGGTLSGDLDFSKNIGLKCWDGANLLTCFDDGSVYLSEQNKYTIINGSRERPSYNSPTTGLVEIALTIDKPYQFAQEEYNKSKNLFNGNLQYGAWIFADGNYTWTEEYRCSTNYIEVVPGSTITLSAKGNYTEGGSGFVFYNNGSYVGYADHTFTATVPANANQVLFNIFIGSNSFNLTDIQLEYGNVVTPYQSYNSSSHITNPQADFLKEEYNKSANLLNITSGKANGLSYSISGNSLRLYGATDAYATYQIDLSHLKGQEVTLSIGSVNVVSGIPFVVFYADTDIFNEVASNGFTKTFTVPTNANTIVLSFYANRGSTTGDITLTNIMLNKGSSALPFQPYQGGEIIHREDIAKVTLFEGSTNESLTLTDNVENYDYIKIFYDIWGVEAQNSMEFAIRPQTPQDICLFDTTIDDSNLPTSFGIVNHYKRMRIQEKSVNVSAAARLWGYSTDNNLIKDNQNQTYIKKILGYKGVK